MTETTAPKSISQKSVHTRLLWQTWHEARWLLGLPLLVSATFVIAFFFLTGTFEALLHDWKLQLLASAIFVVPSLILIPALHGAFAFYIDQRKHQARFLCNHGVSARHVWFARHFVWFGGMVVVLLCVTLLPTAWNASSVFHEIQELRSWSSNDYALSEHAEVMCGVGEFVQEHAFRTICAILAAYAIGQCVSMFVRSGLLACFLTLVLATVLATWLAVAIAWHLSAWLFVLPIAIGLLLATWLRAPDWIAERNAPVRWLKPAAAIALPILAIAMMLPSVRLTQIPQEQAELAAATVEDALENLQAADTPEARETAQMYRRVVQMLNEPLGNDPLEKWNKSEYRFMYGMGDEEEEFSGWNTKKIPAEELDAFRIAYEETKKLLAEQFRAASKLARLASLRPTCRFELTRIAKPYNLYHLNYFRPKQMDVMAGYDCEFEPIMIVLMRPHQKADNLLTALRMLRHIRSGQTIWIHLATLKYESVALTYLAEWASHEETTKDQIREALWELGEIDKLSERSEACFAVAHQTVRKVLEGQHSPLVLAGENVSQWQYLPYLANKLSWERQRAQRVLDITTARNIDIAKRLHEALSQPALTNYRLPTSRRKLLAIIDGFVEKPRVVSSKSLLDLQTSYLASVEYAASVPAQRYLRELVDTETCWRACRLQLALEMYRHDHDRYPSQLTELAPEYLDAIPGDPWSGKGFQWHPDGLELPHWQRKGYGKLVAAGTPLLWSVGRLDHSMKRNSRTLREELSEEEQLPSEETPPAKTELVYEMWEFDGHSRWHDNDLVFPLQKPAK